MGTALSPAAEQAANYYYYIQVLPPPPSGTPHRTGLDGVVIFMFVWACGCFMFNLVFATSMVDTFEEIARTDARQRDNHPLRMLSEAALCIIAAAIIIGPTAVPPLLVVALVPGAAYRFGMAWLSVGILLTPLLGLIAGVAYVYVEWRRFIFRYRCLAGHPAVVVPDSEPQPAPAAPPSATNLCRARASLV